MRRLQAIWVFAAIGMATPLTLATALEYEPEVVLEVPYGRASNQVGVSTARLDVMESSDVGPRNFEIVGDSAVYIGDAANGKVKRFRIGGGFEMETEGRVDCVNGIAVSEDGRIFVAGPMGEGDVAVFDREGKKLLQTPTMILKVSGRESEWTGQRVADVVSEARAAGLGKSVLRDGAGREYQYERVKGDKRSFRFSVTAGGDTRDEFEIQIDENALPSELRIEKRSVDYWSVDSRGQLYAVCSSVKPEPMIILEWEDREPLVSMGDMTILVYDRTGVVLGGIRYDRPPANMVSYYDVAKVMPNGNIYCYNYTAEGLEIVRYRPIEE